MRELMPLTRFGSRGGQGFAVAKVLSTVAVARVDHWRETMPG